MAMKRLLIIKRLEDEGIFSMNKETELPLVPQRIAVISSKSAAGFSDFINHLNGNSYKYIFHTHLFETVMQGPDTEESIIKSLDRIALNLHLFDMVVIIRGGGSQADLSWFDNYNIAYYITQFPLPVITGIGHDKDMSVTDMVAYESMKTPTAVADFLIHCMKETENHLMELSNNITDISKTILEQNKSRLDSFRITLVPTARLMLSEIKEDLSGKIIETINIGKEYLTKAGLAPANQKSRLLSSVKAFSLEKETNLKIGRHDLMNFVSVYLKNNNLKMAMLGNTLEMVRPENVLKRGYSITSFKGKIIKNSTEVSSGEIIDTKFSDGTVSSKII
jgi:exodeoxyribonuclease VII large subunit